MDELRFKIDVFRPETLPMARLAEYMAALAALLGSQKSVHFVRLDSGSVELVHAVDYEDQPKVRSRISSVRLGDVAVSDALVAYRRLDDMLANDNAVGRLLTSDNDRPPAEILVFPGRERPRPQVFGPFSQEGSLEGVLISVGGKDETISIRLSDGAEIYSNCETNRTVARELGKHLFEPIRIHGVGRWSRDAHGNWKLLHFRVQAFDVLEPANLREAVAALRAVPGSGWRALPNPLEELDDLRDDNGGLH